MAYQTVVVHIMGIVSIFLALIATNTVALGITHPWILIVLIPGSVGALFYAGNQMKTIGAPAPGSTRTETTTETTKTPEKP